MAPRTSLNKTNTLKTPNTKPTDTPHLDTGQIEIQSEFTAEQADNQKRQAKMQKKAESIKVILQVCQLSSKEKQNGWKIGTIVHKNEGVIGISNSRGEASKTFHF